MNKKNRITSIGISTGLALSIFAPYNLANAQTNDQLQVNIEDENYRAGDLTLPSQKAPEHVVKDALKEKTKQALSPKQVNKEEKVDFKITQKRPSYDGTTLVRMQQTYEDREVYGYQLTAHVDKKGVIKSISGDSAQNLQQQSDLKNPVKLSKDDAKQYIYKKYGNDITFIDEAESKLVIYVDENTKKATTAYQVTFSAATPQYVSGTYLMNAFNGEILKDMVQESSLKVDKKLVQLLQNDKKKSLASLTGRGTDDSGITRTFGISQQSNGKYALADYSRGKGIETYDVNYKDITTQDWAYPGNLVTSTSTTFNDSKAVSAHYLATKVYDFYKDTYKRNSFDNLGKKVVSVVHAWDSTETNDPKQWFNALSSNSSTSSMLVYGDPLVKAYDVAGHEFTHSVTASESKLKYEGQSGAINEALSDIFGVAVEKYANNGTFNWTVGEQAGDVFRDMANPSSLSTGFGAYPDDFKDYKNLPLTSDGDYGGVHINSSIINKVAYLIANGGTHNNVAVRGIGEDKMFDIFYYANTDELNMSSDFKELKAACIRVATNLYGANSSEVQAVQQAYKAAFID
ncbi:M4 family metallopeptidase [Bacillus pseudomycoides]|uniref:Neutral metalloproteinase n=1 Tax=Bacillus bingmayongensis TaxID=1150157 RepID=A0ABU5K382_9BACI|nr:M4 family metallopeptidase [Bacillus pseudomycoides]